VRRRKVASGRPLCAVLQRPVQRAPRAVFEALSDCDRWSRSDPPQRPSDLRHCVAPYSAIPGEKPATMGLDKPQCQGSSMEDQDQRATATETNGSRSKPLVPRLRARYDGSFAQELVSGLGEVDFGDRIIIFGASLLLSVLPLIIVLSAYATHRIQDDIAEHLGLSQQGTKIVEGLSTRQSRHSTWRS
jgi:hypothetical protein